MRKNIDMVTHDQLTFLSGKLPLVMVNTHEKHIMTKAELEEMGYVGAEKMEDGRYMYKAPVMVAQNHYRCMRRAFLRGGTEAVGKYIERVKSLKNA
jgi:hypothetical protein